uniref:Spindle apparatus coiled-coil protein 1 n=1 Tax=Hucho hucho TaxID=62062 RepID=A0A4W5NQ94_9TELE
MSTSGDDVIQRLQHKLKEADGALDGQLDLQNKLDEQRIEITNTVEALKQEKYSLQREVELKSHVLDSLRSDYDLVKSQQRLQWEKQQSLLERNHAMELNECKNKVEKIKAELDEAQLSEKQLKRKLELQTEILRNKMEELRLVTERTHETMSSELMELQEERMELEAATLEQALQEAQYIEQHLELTNTNLQSVSCFNKALKANQDLQIQLDQVLQQAQDPNSKGNSLFGERAAIKRQLIRMKVQHRSLQKQHVITEQHLHPMKIQIATMMQLQGSRADPAQLECLQSMLSEKNSEIQALKIKLCRPEKVEVMFSCLHSPLQPQWKGQWRRTSNTYLKMQLLNSVKDAERLGDELSMQRMKPLSESQRALELERKFFSVVRALKQSQSDNIKLQVKVEEFRLKYEPNVGNKYLIQKRKCEKLPIDMPSNLPEVKKEEPMVLEMELPKHMKEETEAEAHPCIKARATVTPLQPPNSPKPNPALPGDSKCVRICEEPPTIIPNPPMSVSPWKVEVRTEAMKRKKLKCQQVIHVTLRKTSVLSSRSLYTFYIPSIKY